MGKVINNTIGRIRKSVGQNNFYVRSGVQVMRLKPSFSPDRKFTDLQKYQQMRMKIVRKFIETYDLGYWAQSINNANNRRYNASSRFNRLLGFLLKNISDSVVLSNMTDADIPEWIENNIAALVSHFAVGNILNPVTSVSVGVGTNGTQIDFNMSGKAIDRCLAVANRRRIKSNWYDVSHFWAIGWLVSSTYTEKSLFVCDQLNPVKQSSGDYKGSIDAGSQRPGSSASGTFSFAVFLHSDDYDAWESSRFSSNNIILDWARGQDGPIVQ